MREKKICASPALGKMKSSGGAPKSRVSARPENTPDEDEVCSAPPLASAAIEQAPTFVGIFDAGLRPVLLSRAGRQMVGLDAGADINNLALRDFFTLEHGRILDEVVLPEMLRHGHWNGDLRLRHFEEPAVEVAVHLSSFALFDEGGALIGAAMISSDISERQGGQSELRQSRSLLEAIVGDLPLGVGAYDRSGALLTGNDEFRRRAGVTALPSIDPEAQLHWQGFTSAGERIAPENFPGERALRGERVVPGEDFLYSSDGEVPRWTRVSAVPFSREGDEEGGAIVVVQDIDDIKRSSERLRRSEARLRAASELVGLAIYSWDPILDTLEWDERLQSMWGLAPGVEVTAATLEKGIHPDDLPRVQAAIAQSIDPAGDGRYDIEFRVIGKSDGVERCVATSGQATFEHGRATGFIGAAVDVTDKRRAEAAIRDSEECFRSFAAHTSNLLWIIDPAQDVVEYRSPAYERISGEPAGPDPMPLTQWLARVHPEDQAQVLAALESVKSGHAMQYDYRVLRGDGLVRWLRETSFPICDEAGRVVRIGGIAADLTRPDGHQVYLVGAGAKQSRELAGTVRGLGLQVRTFATADAFLDIAPVLARGCVLVDLRGTGHDPTAVPRELKARAIPLPCVLIGNTDAAAEAVAAMKAGAADYLLPTFDGATLKAALKLAIAKVHDPVGFQAASEEAVARVARLTKREREVLVGLVDGGTNKVIGKKLGISPRTVELHRAQVMNRLNAASLPELVQVAIAAGIRPAADPIPAGRKGLRTPT